MNKIKCAISVLIPPVSAPRREAEYSSETSKNQPNHFVVLLIKRTKNEYAVKALNYHPKRNENFFRQKIRNKMQNIEMYSRRI